MPDEVRQCGSVSKVQRHRNSVDPQRRLGGQDQRREIGGVGGGDAVVAIALGDRAPAGGVVGDDDGRAVERRLQETRERVREVRCRPSASCGRKRSQGCLRQVMRRWSFMRSRQTAMVWTSEPAPKIA